MFFSTFLCVLSKQGHLLDAVGQHGKPGERVVALHSVLLEAVLAEQQVCVRHQELEQLLAHSENRLELLDEQRDL